MRVETTATVRSGILYLISMMSAWIALTGCGRTPEKAELRVSYGNNGIHRLTFNDAVLEDLGEHPADAFHIWHMKAVDGRGKVLKGQQYDWGENNNGRSWNAATHAWTYSFTWGSIGVQFEQRGDTLDMSVTEKNSQGSGITFFGAAIYPFALHFPRLPSGFGEASYQHLAVRPSDPAPVADFGAGQVTTTASAGSKPLYYGFEPAGGGAPTYFPIISSTALDSLAPSFLHVDRPVREGETDTFMVTLKFANSPSSSR